jgi:phage/plasmid-like protein (TIGR03299 family)
MPAEDIDGAWGTYQAVGGPGQPLQRRIKVADQGHSVVRTDRWTVLGTVGDQWQPLQNREGFQVLEPLLDAGLAKIETGGSLREGRDVWMLFSIDREALMAKAGAAGDPLAEMLAEVAPFALITNNHAGQRKAIVRETPIRVVCANTLDAALDARDQGCSVAVEHSTNVKQNLEQAAAMMFGNIVERFTRFATVRQDLRSTVLTERAFGRLVLDRVVPIDHLFRKIQRKEFTGHTVTAHRKASEKRDAIRQLWEAGAEHAGDHSAWEAYNGMVQALDHDKRFVPGVEDQPERRLTSMYDGNIRLTKGRVLRGLLQYVDTPEQDKGEFVKALGGGN